MIILKQHNAIWLNDFESEKILLTTALGDKAISIDHIGSTAIANICAKPVIDILIGVKDLQNFTQKDILEIEKLGYNYNPIFEETLPYRRYFQKSKNGIRTHQIHLVNKNSAWFEKHILFRDYLKTYHNEARAYEKLKLELAKKFDDTISYANAKTDFCSTINTKAYFDFNLHKPNVITNRLYGYIPQMCCFEIYKKMFQDLDFIHCYGVKLHDEKIQKILTRDTAYWDQYGFGTYVWFDQATQQFVGEGGLNHTVADGHTEIELTYSLEKSAWGKGYAVEIGNFAIDQAFNQLSLNNIVCFTSINNRQSLRVIEKLKFNYEKKFIYVDLAHQLFRLHK
jgi:GrpB-like predicted nucleotidyltransferase (UPF0157 family)/predicted acetyltransferase